MLRPYQSLGLTDIYFHCSRKTQVMLEWMGRHNLAKEEVAYVGDDIPDIKAMLEAGLSVTPADGAREVKEIARYISPFNGGHGVARDLIMQILSAKGQWLSPDAYEW
ncbi:MAG: HAD hydrolase family protein [Muribaculaceae bacterium]|nr:HAD hydrolase family protein [Muribaculaceae bacterium]